MTMFLWRGKEGALEAHGLEHLAHRADISIGVLTTKNREIEYVDIDPADLALIQCAERIRDAWAETFPEEAYLGMAAFGKWCWLWLSPQLKSAWDLLRANDSDGLRALAEDYVAARFGADRGPTIDDHPGAVPALTEA